MDYETKIYLDKLIEAVDKLNSPDWWMIVLTVINIVAFVFVACTQIKIQKHQTKLQEQQNKAQEYEFFRSLYKVVNRVHFIDNFLIRDIIDYFIYEIPITPQYNKWRNTFDELTLLSNQFDELYIDINLKYSRDFKELQGYQRLFLLMRQLTSYVERLITEQKIDYSLKTFTMPNEGRQKFIKSMAQRVAESEREVFMAILSDYMKARDDVDEMQTIAAIKRKCKID